MSNDLADALKNGTRLPEGPTYSPPPALLALAQNMLNAVKSGQVTSLAAIAVGPAGQIQCPFVGELPLINLGVDLMKGEVLAAIRTPQPGRIMRAHG